ncbi:MAG: class II fructose-bisphosphate aldolase [Treponema sp.]|jgi:fructose-bisphosphate aldolase class II/tagatose 1,6-diphosphate aldolase GatY/KbaY|nr:class II fructose-bisphosphate aldolase [Treponema sp.]
MALVKVRELLDAADKANSSIIAFDAGDYNMIQALVTAADEAKKPLIIMLYPLMRDIFSFGAFAATVKNLASRAKYPIGLHLDHCQDYRVLMEAIRDGFPSIMADGSMLPFDQNVAFTAKVVETAHAFGVDVEAELGHVGQASNTGDYSNRDLFTLPDEAARFAEITKIDSLAVSFGSAHGFYKTTPNLDIERLQEINKATDVPLVLHGGSGIPSDQLEKAFTNGINKFNVGTEFFALNNQKKKEFWSTADPSKSKDEVSFIRKALVDYLVKKLELCRI